MEVLAQNGLKTPQDLLYLDFHVIQEMKYLSPITKAKLKKLVTHLGFQAVSSEAEKKMPTARTDEIMSQVGLSSPFPDPAPPILSSTPVAHSSGHLLHEPSNRHSDSSIGATIGGKRGGEAYGVQQGVTNSFVSSWRGAEQRHSFAASTAAAAIAAGIFKTVCFAVPCSCLPQARQ